MGDRQCVSPSVDPRVSFAAGLIVLLLAVLAVGDRTGPLLFVTFSTTALLLLFTFVWMAGRLGPGEGRQVAWRFLETALALCFAWGVYIEGQEAIAETRWANSGSREMAEYISANVSDATVIVAHPPIYCESILAYLPRRVFWYADRQQFGSYMLWNALAAGQMPRIDARALGRQRFAGRKWLLLLNGELSEADRKGFHLVATNRREIYAHPLERYWLYSPE